MQTAPRLWWFLPSRSLRGGLLLVLIFCSLLPSVLPARGVPEELPNLRPVLAETLEVFIEEEDPEFDFERTLRLETRALNTGPFPLELQGGDLEPQEAGSLPTAPARQCIAFAENGTCQEYRDAGTLQWFPIDNLESPEHCHAYQGAARYELRRLLPGDAPDMSASGLVGSMNASFSFFDERRGGDYEGAQSAYPTCIPPHLRQGLSVGFTVYRHPDDRDQFIWLGSRNGFYALVITLDPNNRIKEQSESDNRLAIKVRLNQDEATNLGPISLS